ncbi:esterase [Lithospermum erythrorhizon]|uniref:Esterase n=1 Tax=Lithospermum erythrorhizon TaxID=34254 RepID=A0AAV3PF85_LITER
MEKKHFIFVHGACHGAWAWYKVKPQLEAQGHKVNAIDLSGAGISTTKMEEVHSLYDYSLPLMNLLETIPSNEKVILVGHSFGGFSLALAADKYPDKISVAVFVAAFMPDCQHFPSYTFKKKKEEYSEGGVEDMHAMPYGSGDKPQRMLSVFTPNFVASHLYQLCSPQVS